MSNYSAWSIKIESFPSGGSISERIAFLCRYGSLAPSVHNIQPWHFEISNNSLAIRRSSQRSLEAGDPTGRETWISIGACLENILIAGEYFGLEGTETKHTPDAIEYTFKETGRNHSFRGMLEAITARSSNRGPFSNRLIDQKVIDEIAGVACAGVEIVASSDVKLRDMVADLTSRAIGMALGNPSFRKELGSLIESNWTKNEFGMPGFTLGVPGPVSLVEKRLVSNGLRTKKTEKNELTAMKASAALVIVFTDGDSQPFWINAGQAYERVGLIATHHGLSLSTSAAIVEAADFHLDIERYCQTKGRLQTVMRIGYSTGKSHHSPRLGIEKLVTISS